MKIDSDPTFIQAFRGSLLHFVGDPDELGQRAYEYFDDGLLVLRDGKIAAAGTAQALRPTLPAGAELVDYSGKLIVPGNAAASCPRMASTCAAASRTGIGKSSQYGRI